VRDSSLWLVVNFINILRTLFCWYLFTKMSQRRIVIREKLGNLLSYEKCSCKMLMKSTPRVNLLSRSVFLNNRDASQHQNLRHLLSVHEKFVLLLNTVKPVYNDIPGAGIQNSCWQMVVVQRSFMLKNINLGEVVVFRRWSIFG